MLGRRAGVLNDQAGAREWEVCRDEGYSSIGALDCISRRGHDRFNHIDLRCMALARSARRISIGDSVVERVS